jgi:GNAT superfamily N-acetyltransferase
MIEEVNLVLATENDAQQIHQMKYDAFLPLYENYHDDETSPVKEPLDKVMKSIQQDNCDYYLIQFQKRAVGAVKVIEKKAHVFYISPLFVIPEFQNRGIGYATIQQLFEKYPSAVTWRLDTILQEKGNCHLYEKCGFIRTGKQKTINEKMTLVAYAKNNLLIRKFCEADAETVANLIIRNFKEVNSKDYEQEVIDELVKTHDAAWVLEVASYANMYVFCMGEKVIAVGSISSFWGSETESILLTVFVLPEFHGKGIGRTIIQTLERDELFTRASRIEIPASITAVNFYKKFGYGFKNGREELDEEGHYRLEKFKTQGNMEVEE